MSDEGRKQVLGVLAEAREAGQGISQKVFVAEFCAVAKCAENWVKAKRHHYGQLAELPAFERVEAFLRSARARLEILACMKSGIRLEGISPAQRGIEQCNALVAELQALRARSMGPSEF